MTQAHAGWLSVQGMSRYHRFLMKQVVAIPSAMLGLSVPGASEPRVVQHVRGPRRVSVDVDNLRADPAVSGSGPASRDASVSEVAGVHLPPGYVREVRSPAAARSSSSRDYVVILAPDGHACQSRPDAWRYYLSTSGTASVPVPSDAPVPVAARRASPVRRRTPSSSAKSLRLPEDFVVVESLVGATPTCAAASSSATRASPVRAGSPAPRATAVRSLRLGSATDAQALIRSAFERRKQLRASKKGSRELGRLVG